MERPLADKARYSTVSMSRPMGECYHYLEYDGDGRVLREGVMSQVESALLHNHIRPTLLLMGGAERRVYH